MATGLVGQHQVATFTSPVNGTTPVDANTVRGNDNSLKTGYDAHDNDTTIHIQNSTLAARPAASVAGQKWMTSDTFRIYFDDGAAWNEAAYLPTSGGTVTGTLTITSASASALAVGLNGATNPSWQVDNSTALQAAGLKLSGAVAAGTVALAVISSGSNANLSVNAKGTGTIIFQGTAATQGAVGFGYFNTLTPGEGSGIDPTTTAQVDIVKTSGTSQEVFLRFRQQAFDNGMPHQDTATSVGGIQAATGALGGLTVYGLSTGTHAYRLLGCITTETTTTGATDDAAIKLQGVKGESSDLSATANLLAIMNNANNVVLFKGSGQITSAATTFGVGSLATPTSELANETVARILATTLSVMSLATSRANTDGQNIGVLAFEMTSNTASYQARASIAAQSSGANANKRGAKLLLSSSADNNAGTSLALTLDVDQTALFASTAITPASTTARAGLRLPHGSAPTSPVNGDVWTTTAGIFVRVNGATVGPLS